MGINHRGRIKMNNNKDTLKGFTLGLCTAAWIAFFYVMNK
jgi:hypothetical protein